MPFVSWYTCCVSTQWQLGKMYSYLETGEFHGRNAGGGQALKQFVRNGGIKFSRISHSRCLSGSVMCFKKLKKIA